MKEKKNRKKVLLCLAVLSILTVLCIISWKLFVPSYEGKVTAKIYQDGALLYTIPLDGVMEDYELVVKGKKEGENRIFVSREGIAVSYADCPDQVCVKRGTVAYSEIPIVCIPNKLTIVFEKAGAKETDM